MASALLNDLNKTNNDPVNFQMRHVLTCIGFKASGDGERITKITAKGVKNLRDTYSGRGWNSIVVARGCGR